MIVGGIASGSSKKVRKTYLQMVQNVQLTGFIPKMARIDNAVIGFTEENARRLHHPYNDALVVSIRVGDYNTHRVLVDNRSSTEILYYLAFQQMRIDREQLIPVNTPFVRFGGTKVHPLGVVTLPVTIGDYPRQITRDVTFLVVDCSSAYNAILGRPTLNSWKAVTSTYHLMIKFPTKYGVGEVLGDQVAACECYITMLKMVNHIQTMRVEEQQKMAKPMEGLEEIILDDSRPNRTTKISILASTPVRQKLTTFLKKNQDIFAWNKAIMKTCPGSILPSLCTS